MVICSLGHAPRQGQQQPGATVRFFSFSSHGVCVTPRRQEAEAECGARRGSEDREAMSA